jgi:sugar lactone lactonase YvrE
MPREYRAATASSMRFSLAEGVIFDDRADTVRWVDIDGGDVVQNLADPQTVHVDRTVGAVALAEDGGLLVAAHRGLATISPTGEVSLGPDLLGDREAVRLNDGIVDAQGRFLVGTLSLGGPSTSEQLLRISPDGTVEVLRSGIRLSNGLGFSPDGSTLYHTDTFARTISSHPYDASARENWDSQNWTPVLTDFTGNPDGMTVDSNGNLWVAEYGAARVQCFSPDGELLDRVDIGTPESTCPGFIGPGMLAVTSGREQARDAEAGAVYTCAVDASGPTENRWAGSTTTPYWI